MKNLTPEFLIFWHCQIIRPGFADFSLAQPKIRKGQLAVVDASLSLSGKEGTDTWHDSNA